jgi:hypothetical protein
MRRFFRVASPFKNNLKPLLSRTPPARRVCGTRESSIKHRQAGSVQVFALDTSSFVRHL